MILNINIYFFLKDYKYKLLYIIDMYIHDRDNFNLFFIFLVATIHR